MDYSFGSWIKRRRKALDLTRQDLADQVGCSVASIIKIESDDRRPSRQIAELLAEHLQIPADQRLQFLKAARREKMIESLEPVPLPPESPGQPAPEPPKSNLPAPLTPLVGRENELNMIIRQLSDPGCRMLTLTGLGGVGKTRLALEAANRLQGKFGWGVFFIPLSGISDPRFILPAIAESLGFVFAGEADPGKQLLHYIREKEILLVLDNFEHLIPGADFLIEILQEAQRVKFLATSREPLSLQAEWTFEVQGLPVPTANPENSVQAGSAALLFVQRARQARLDFALGPGEHQAVLRICHLVEGLPLGIELAAAWVRVLTCEQISIEIERNLDFLKAAARDLPERHRSLRAVLDQSWDRLSETEKDVFRKLSIFRGGFRREAAQAVAGAELAEIAALLNKSLVKRVGEKRYDMHEFVRQYASSHLESDPQEHEQTIERYICYYANLLEEWQVWLRSPRQSETLVAMGAEMDNLRQAWSWMIAHQQPGYILKSLYCFWHFYEILGRHPEGEALFRQAADALQAMERAGSGMDQEHQAALGLALAYRAYFCSHLGRYEQAGEAIKRSLVLLRESTNGPELAEALTCHAYYLYRLGELQLARDVAMESLNMNRAIENPVGTALSLVMLSYLYLVLGQPEMAYETASESLSISRNVGDPYGTADGLIPLSMAARQIGQNQQARIWAQEALEISRSNNHRLNFGLTLWQLGMIQSELGETQEAADLVANSVRQFRETGDRTLVARALVDLGAILRGSGSLTESKQALLEALCEAVELPAQAIAWRALVEFARSEMEQGKPERALELVAFVLDNAENNLEAVSHASQLKERLDALLTPEQIEPVEVQVPEMALADFVKDFCG